MFSFTFNINWDKFKASIDKAGTVLPYDNIMRISLLKLQRDAIEKTPKKTGTARRNYFIRQLAPLVWNLYNKIFYVKILEEGSKPHTILPKNVSVLSWLTNKGNVHATEKVRTISKLTGKELKKPTTEYRIFTKKVNHPGTRPYKMVESSLPDTKRFIETEFRKQIEAIFK